MNYQLSEEKRDKFVFLVYILFFALLVLTTVLLLYFNFRKDKYENKVVVVETDIELSSSRSAVTVNAPVVYSLTVLNATGVTGLASEAVKKIESSGVKVTAKTGNASPISGQKVTYKSDLLKESQLGKVVLANWPSSMVGIDGAQAEDLIIVIGR